jgi:hypothetical protein
MKKLILAVIISILNSALLFADAGILIPRDQQQPDPAILSLEEMEITIRIDNGDARVFVRQIFANHTGGSEEGNYIFALPSHATLSDFATWDGRLAFPQSSSSASVPKKSTTSSSNRLSIPGSCRWANVALKMPSERRSSALASLLFLRMGPSVSRSSITSRFR